MEQSCVCLMTAGNAEQLCLGLIKCKFQTSMLYLVYQCNLYHPGAVRVWIYGVGVAENCSGALPL